MDQLWLSAPGLALKVWRDDAAVAWRANPALIEWSARRDVASDDWRIFATELAAACTASLPPEDRSVRFAGEWLHWTGVALDEGWLIWLVPPSSAPADSAQPIDDSEVARRMRAQEELNAKLTRLLNLASVSVWRIDLASRKVQFNDFGYRMTGLQGDRDGVPLEAVRATIHPDDLHSVMRAAEQAIAGSEVIDVEARYRNPDGSYRHLLTRRVAERDASGRAVSLVGVSIDQSQRILERERARALARRIDLITDAAGVGVWSVDIDADIVEWNAQMFVIYGMPPEKGAPSMRYLMDHLVHPDDRALLAKQRKLALDASRRSLQFEFRIVRPDRALRWLSTWWRREARDGRAMAFGVTLDVTDRHEAEQALRDKAAAEQASRAKSEFLSRMSHELRTPLNAVLGFTQLLQHDPRSKLDARQVDWLAHIHSAGLHLTALIDDVLDLASIESNVSQLTCEPVALQSALDDVLQWSGPQAERSGIVLHAKPMAGWVLADSRRLRQIIANLLSNAIKYNRPRGQVWLEAQPGDVGGQSGWQLRVRDSGRGMSPAQMAHLFEPFNRLGAEREGIQGTGIGLAIVRHFLQSMGGSIEVDSVPRQGSEFRFTLPAATPPVSAPAVQRGELPAAAAVAAPALSVLYIEDNAVNLLLVQELLALRPNVRLSTAVDGASGVAKARAESPDVILVDMQLPDFDGFEVLRRLKNDPALAQRSFIALSASAMPEEVGRARAAGFSDYWTKPIDFAQFLAGVDALAAAAH